MGSHRDFVEARAEQGFSLIEVIIAVLILTVGLLGLAGTTGYVIRQVTLADLQTERTAALQTAVERLRATPYNDLEAGWDSVGLYRVEWSPVAAGGRSLEMEIVTLGPGRRAGGYGSMPVVSGQVADTFRYRIMRP